MVYSGIGDYGVIGNLRTVALVSRAGSVDWFCYPYIDSPSVFGALLDHERGGRFSIHPESGFDSAARYEVGTNILVTHFRTRVGVLRLTDFMTADHGDEADAPGHAEIHRILEVERGDMVVRLCFEPRFDYARAQARFDPVEGGFEASGGGVGLTVTATRELRLDERASRVEGVWKLAMGDRVLVRVGTRQIKPEEPQCDLSSRRCVSEPAAFRALERTRSYWREWLGRSETGRKFPYGPFRDMVDRSALTLKLLYFGPTGTIAAAATTSLPEEIGGVRNWDYRYTWLRDTSFTLQALFELGHLSETEGYLRWIEGVLAGSGAEGLQIMYGLRGETELTETELDHLEGYKGSRPVRVGNGAARQKQLDIHGELMDAALKLSDYVGKVDAGLWPALKGICDYVCAHWREPDSGIWEVRGGPFHFVHSKVMCWVALDRGLTISRRYGFSADRAGWRRECEAIREEVCTRGYNEVKSAFVQHYETDALDASALLLPIMGFLEWDDPRTASTVEAVERDLMRDGLVYRYLTDDGLAGGEGAFLLCTFWYIDCLIGLGRLDEAEVVLRHTERTANHLGLFAEEYDPLFREALGNFPQAFTHIGYVTSVMRLMRAREAAKKEEEGGRDKPGWAEQVRRKLLAPKVLLNAGTPRREIGDDSDLAARLKESMNLLRGAFFDTARGRVAYEKMRASDLYGEYTDLARNLGHFDASVLRTPEEKRAFWINIFNVLVVHGVIELGIRDSVKEVRSFFSRISYDIGGRRFSPDTVEHGILRANSRPPGGLLPLLGSDDPRLPLACESVDPRIHFALVCASHSCPPIGIYEAQTLDRDLTVAGRTFLNAGGARVDVEKRRVFLSRIFSWYKNDFGATMADRLRFVASFLYGDEARELLAGDPESFRVEYQDYDWRLNR